MILPAHLPTTLPLLMAFDLDGTLIPDAGREVAADTAQALARLKTLGVHLAIITGRDTPPSQVCRAMQPDAVATNNGGRIMVGEDLHSEASFSDADLEAVLAHELPGARVVLFTADTLYVDLPGDMKPEPWMQLRQYRPLTDAPRSGILKAGYYHPQVSDFAGRLRGTHPHLVLTGAQDPYPHFLTVTPEGAHKGAALTLIADRLGIAHDRTVAFGDSDNDEAMLEVAAFGVQVGTLPLLARHASAQVPEQARLGEFLHAWADRLQAAAPA
ncbi:Cof-type HAD-IIB family hydrolase [Deinococcus taeanensis]|uniref:HAD hydrolase family protein n=1 Tax=Deinococcus taeanensis TaxID=2737050 RepID=UPI001CDD64BA|nr:HAD family hydrolase [Deinococcus taeanensis]UBV41831.1 Cof-type HAD-IIB family hydrolase [Deinococcus taeanensis]